jgi:pseudaminic acid synthase
VTAPIVAVSLGARVIEKHFILDKNLPSADKDFSLDPKEFAEMVKAVRDSEKLLGKVDYSMNEKKKKNRQFARSLYVVKDIKKGEKFTNENIRSIRPGFGLHPKYLFEILGKTAICDIKRGERMKKSYLNESMF